MLSNTPDNDLVRYLMAISEQWHMPSLVVVDGEVFCRRAYGTVASELTPYRFVGVVSEILRKWSVPAAKECPLRDPPGHAPVGAAPGEVVPRPGRYGGWFYPR